MNMAQRCADQVGRDGVRQEWARREMPASMQAYYNRVLASDGFGGILASQRRDRRESETLCVLMDQLTLGRFQGDLLFGCLCFCFVVIYFVRSVFGRMRSVGVRWFCCLRALFGFVSLSRVVGVVVQLYVSAPGFAKQRTQPPTD